MTRRVQNLHLLDVRGIIQLYTGAGAKDKLRDTLAQAEPTLQMLIGNLP